MYPHGLLALLLWAPCLTHAFSLQLRTASRATITPSSSQQRCPTPLFVTQKSEHYHDEAIEVTWPKIRPPTCGTKLVVERFVGTVLLGGSLLVAGIGIVSGADNARADVSISPRCIDGEGAQCDDLSEGIELIKTLQARSALNKEKYVREALERYNEHNFKDYFRAENKHMVRHKDGKYEILTNTDYREAERAGKVKDDVFLHEE